MKKALVALAAICVVGSIPAWADGLTFAGTYSVTGNGFGSSPRALTIQSHGPSSNVESGCIAPNGSGGLIAGSSACMAGGANVGGNEQNPIAFPKQSAPTLSSLGVNSGSELGILFDGVQPQNGKNSVVNIDNLTLKLFSGTTLVFSASGTFSGLATNPGNGSSDYLFTLSSAAASAFDAALGGNLSDTVALDSTISFARQSAAADSYSFINLGSSTTSGSGNQGSGNEGSGNEGGGNQGGGNGGTTTPIAATPEPSSLLLLATGVLGMGFTRRKLTV